MDKGRKTKPYAVYNKAIIKRLREKFGFSAHFIYASLRGDRTSESSAEICKTYKVMESELTKILNKL